MAASTSEMVTIIENFDANKVTNVLNDAVEFSNDPNKGQFDETVTAPSKTEKLTMYTCHPFNFIGKAPNRFIVTCDLVSAEKTKEGEK